VFAPANAAQERLVHPLGDGEGRPSRWKLAQKRAASRCCGRQSLEDKCIRGGKVAHCQITNRRPKGQHELIEAAEARIRARAGGRLAALSTRHPQSNRPRARRVGGNTNSVLTMFARSPGYDSKVEAPYRNVNDLESLANVSRANELPRVQVAAAVAAAVGRTLMLQSATADMQQVESCISQGRRPPRSMQPARTRALLEDGGAAESRAIESAGRRGARSSRKRSARNDRPSKT
jgi:hypothetical protein